MPRVRCYQTDCVYWKAGFCQAREIELDPEGGCLTVELEDFGARYPDTDWEDELLDEFDEEDW